MFDNLRRSIQSREKKMLSGVLQKKFRESKSEIQKRKDRVSYEIQKLEGEIDNLFAQAEVLKQEGKVDESKMIVYQALEKGNALEYLSKSMEVLSFYDSKIGLMQARVLSRDTIAKTAGKNRILDHETERMIKRYASLDEWDVSSQDLDMNELEKVLDAPLYNPATHEQSYVAAEASLRSAKARNPFVERRLRSYMSDVVQVKD